MKTSKTAILITLLVAGIGCLGDAALETGTGALVDAKDDAEQCWAPEVGPVLTPDEAREARAGEEEYDATMAEDLYHPDANCDGACDVHVSPDVVAGDEAPACGYPTLSCLTIPAPGEPLGIRCREQWQTTSCTHKKPCGHRHGPGADQCLPSKQGGAATCVPRGSKTQLCRAP